MKEVTIVQVERTDIRKKDIFILKIEKLIRSYPNYAAVEIEV